MASKTFLQMTYKGGKGKIAINLGSFLPCSVGDFKKLLDIVADSGKEDEHAETLHNYITGAVQDLKVRRDQYSEETENGRIERQKVNVKIKKFVALSEKLADRFQTDPVSAEDENAKIRMKSATVYAIWCRSGEPKKIEVFNGWTFEKGGRTFEVYKYATNHYKVLLAGTGTECARAKSKSAAPYEVTQEILQILDNNQEKLAYYRMEYTKTMIAAGYIEAEPEKGEKEDATKETRKEETITTRESAPKKEGKKMAMTNAQIIFNERIELAKEGVIRYTGRKLRCGYIDDNEEQTIVEIDEPEEIHTFARWKEMGYIVKKGEHARAAFVIWKAAKSKKEEEDDTQPDEIKLERPRMFQKKAFFFTFDQVQPINAAPESEKLLPVVWAGPMLPAVA